MRIALATLLTLVLAVPALAQHQHQGQHQHAKPYAGLQQRDIKALSDQQIADLRHGRGMGLALAAELNGYPGPMHVLEFSDRLQLTAEQHREFQQLFESMKAEAISSGEALIASERALDRAFAEGRISADVLSKLTAEIGEAQGRLRAVHLKYHLTSADLLSREQRQRYADLRGYR
jgi:Spy/CpxP family protein refolding chaperone